jgi:iron complex outermembrane receptor protein
MNTTSIRNARFLLAASLTALPGLAQAVDEIVVTAQKREQSLQDVGISVSALTAELMDDLGVTGPLTLAQSVPAVQFNSASGGNYGMQLTIRGIAQSDYSPHQESPNSMYIDDVYVSAPNMQSAQMFDLERVEVLRGPQGTLFGRNSTGGLVNFITAAPTAETTGYLDATAGDYSLLRVEGAISGALSERVRGRLSGLYAEHDGLKENHLAGQRDLDDLDFYGVRGQLEFDLSDDLTALFRVHYLEDDNREGFYSHIATYFGPDGRAAPLPANVDFWGTGPGNDLQGYRSPYTGPEGEVDYVGFLKRDVTSPSIVLTWDLGETTLTSITNYTTMDFEFDESCAGAPQWTCRDPFTQELDQWSEEIRLNGGDEDFTWVGGVYALGIHSDSTGAFSSPFYAGGDFAFDVFNDISQRTTTLAVFGQGEWRFAERWRGTLGLRLTNDRKTFSSQTYLAESGDFTPPDNPSTVFDPPILLPIAEEPGFPGLVVYDFSEATVGDFAEHDDTDVTGKIQLDYIPSENALFYASISRGIKNAGFSGNAGGTTPITGTPFDTEQVLAYEIGEKLTLLQDRLRLNGAVYYYDYKDYQGFQLDSSIGISPFVVNADAEFMGVELEILAAPTENLEVRASGNWLDSEVKDVETAVGVMDQEAADAPELMANWSVRYTFPVGGGDLALQYSGDFIDEKFHSIDNAPAFRVDSSTGHNARIAYEWDSWEVAAFATNFTDEDRQQSAYDLTASYGYSIATWSPPRQVGVSLRYQFSSE